MLHELKLFHGDLKPENVFYSQYGGTSLFTDSGSLLKMSKDEKGLYLV